MLSARTLGQMMRLTAASSRCVHVLVSLDVHKCSHVFLICACVCICVRSLCASAHRRVYIQVQFCVPMCISMHDQGTPHNMARRSVQCRRAHSAPCPLLSLQCVKGAVPTPRAGLHAVRVLFRLICPVLLPSIHRKHGTGGMLLPAVHVHGLCALWAAQSLACA